MKTFMTLLGAVAAAIYTSTSFAGTLRTCKTTGGDLHCFGRPLTITSMGRQTGRHDMDYILIRTQENVTCAVPIANDSQSLIRPSSNIRVELMGADEANPLDSSNGSKLNRVTPVRASQIHAGTYLCFVRG